MGLETGTMGFASCTGWFETLSFRKSNKTKVKSEYPKKLYHEDSKARRKDLNNPFVSSSLCVEKFSKIKIIFRDLVTFW